ncbi:MAG: hypothetical protein JOZ13_03130 [Alphaproteobacteria bacterium]|nr:hypothetical protein [Alphaproteobacteria bacterium]
MSLACKARGAKSANFLLTVGLFAALACAGAQAGPTHKPLFILSNSGNGGDSIPTNTATALDGPTTVKCAKANGCTIFIASTVSIFQTTNQVHWSVCATVDGQNANPSCPVQDSNVGNLVGSWRQNFTVAAGTHTVQTFITQTGTATLGSWEVDYTVATP